MAQDPVLSLAEAIAQVPELDDAAYLVDPLSVPEVYLAVYAFNDLTDGATWDTDAWDDGTLVPGSFWQGAGQWVGISDRVRGLHWERGCESPLDRPRVGTATLTMDNQDGALSAWVVGGEFATQEGDPITPGDHVDGPIWIRPGTLVRFGAFVVGDDTTWLPFFTGRLAAQEEAVEQFVDGWVDLTINELTADLGGWNGELQSLRGGGESLAARITRLLVDADWLGDSTVDLDDVGDTATFQSTALAQNRLSELYLTGDSVGMRVLCGSDGQLRVTTPQPALDATLDGPRWDVDFWDDAVWLWYITFSNYPEGDEIPIADAKPYSSTDRLVNTATAARAGGTELTVQDGPSKARYGVFDPGGSRDDLIVQSDTTLLAMLRRLVLIGKDDFFGIESVSVDSNMAPTTLPSLLATLANQGLETMTPFTVRWVHPSGSVLTSEVYLSGTTHRITPTEPGAAMQWTATLATAKRV